MEIKIFHVEKEDDGLRLDRWFHRNVPNMPFTIVAKLARKGQIRIDIKRVKINSKVIYNQKIRTPIIEYQNQRQISDIKPSNFEDIKNKIFNSIIHEDEHIIALNKPYDLCVQDGSNVKISIDRVLKLSGFKYHIVHRIDKETTGLLIIAKNANIAAKISKLFRDKKINKSYLSVLCGIPKSQQGIIESKINILDKEYDAKTQFKVISEYKNIFSLVKFTPLTGRKHQIRIHSKSINCPILGDNKHFNFKSKQEIQKSDHLHLHSYLLSFNLYNKNYMLKAKIPKHFQQMIEKYFPTHNLENYDK